MAFAGVSKSGKTNLTFVNPYHASRSIFSSFFFNISVCLVWWTKLAARQLLLHVKYITSYRIVILRTKINAIDVLQTEQLLPVVREISGEFFIFLAARQCSAHRACEKINRLEWETTAFISPDLWLPIIHI